VTSRKLRLVPPPPELAPGAFDDEPPPDEAELEAARALRDALEDGVDPMADALRAAWAPEALAPSDVDALVARSLGDALAPPTSLEVREAERLRAALDDREDAGEAALLLALAAAAMPRDLDPRAHEVILAKVLDDPLAEPSPAEVEAAARLRASLDPASGVTALGDGAGLARALRAAYRPAPIDSERNERLVARALGPSRRRTRGLVVGLASALALAAGVALVVRASGPVAPARAAASLIRSRSTAELFDAAEPFPRSGGESTRIDRIASAREADLRANRFAAWGAR
jgi:hypothetical protein